MVVQLAAVRSENALGSDPSEDDISLVRVVAFTGGPRMVGVVSGVGGVGGSCTSVMLCGGTVGVPVVLESMVGGSSVDLAGIVGGFLFCV